MIELSSSSASTLREEEAKLEEAKRTPFAYLHQRRQHRCASVDSTSSWGSDITDFGCNCYTHDKDVEEVATWLLYSLDQDLAVRPSPPPEYSPCTPSYPTFSFHTAPATLLLHLFLAFLIRWGLLRNVPTYPPPLPKPIPRQVKKKLPLHTYLGKRNPEINDDGTQIYHAEAFSWAYYLYDDIEYVVPPTPGTNEEELRILVSNDWSREKCKAHTADMLRIYRVPVKEVYRFANRFMKEGYHGHAVRLPRDRFDSVSVMRQGNVSWEFGGKDQYWLLIGKDRHLLQQIEKRCQRRPISFVTSIIRFFIRSGTADSPPPLPWFVFTR